MKTYPLINSTAAVAGEWQFTVLDANRNVVREYEPFHNIVTDLGLDRMGSGSALFTHCRIGTGTAAAAATDTQLQSQSAATSTLASSSNANAGSPNYETTSTIVYEFALGAVVGNMAEIGVGWSASTANTLFSRARINDSGGSPTTITVLVSEILQATYRLKIYPKLTDDTGSVTVSGTAYNYTSRLYNAATSSFIYTGSEWVVGVANPYVFTGTLSSITGTGPSGSSSAIGTSAGPSYTPGSYYRDFVVSASITQGNVAGGIKSMSMAFTNYSTLFSYRQFEFDVAIPKDATKTFSMTFRTSWARYP